MRYFFGYAFFNAIVLLIMASLYKELDRFTPLIICAVGLAVGFLGTKPGE